MVYADDFGETIFTTVPIIVAIFEQHDVAVLSPWIYDVLSPSDVIGSVVESRKIVMIESVTLEKDGIELIGTR
jgi:hypothetical protein